MIGMQRVFYPALWLRADLDGPLAFEAFVCIGMPIRKIAMP